jgi:CRP-like cAMP-binding protein
MATYLIRKLEKYTRLSSDDKRAITEAAAVRVRRLGPRQDVIREGERPDRVNLVLEGWGCRFKVLEDGRRQIAAFLVPGDMCDMRMFILKQMDHSVGTLTALTVAEIPKDTLLDLTDNHPRLTRALWWSSLVDEATAREWIVNNSQRDASERLAHLLCELFIRLRAVGLADGDSCEFPATQVDLAETTGLSTVHVNRTLQDLRSADLIVLKGKTLTIPDLERLKQVALFNPNYLHLDREGQDIDANEG